MDVQKHYEAWYKIFPDRDYIQLVYFGSRKKNCLQAARDASLEHGCVPVVITEDGKARWEVQGTLIFDRVINGCA